LSIGMAIGTCFQGNVLPFILRGVSLVGVNAEMTASDEREHVWELLGNFRANNPDFQRYYYAINMGQLVDLLTARCSMSNDRKSPLLNDGRALVEMGAL